MDLNESAARVRRYLFDFSPAGRSTLDQNMAQLVPFWTYMSKNVPFQIVNRWRNPSAYIAYNNLMKALSDGNEGTAPQWLQETNATSLGGGNFLTMNLGQDRVDQQLQMLSDPWRLTKDVNPLLRVPLEIRGGRRLYNNVPFSSKPQQIPGGPLEPLAELLLRLTGNVHPAQKVGPGLQVGDKSTSSQASYALMNLLPLLSQSEHLAPSTDYYKQNQMNSWLRFAGVPIEHFTPQQTQQNQIAQQQALLKALKKQMK
jgi:hypothetical protein